MSRLWFSEELAEAFDSVIIQILDGCKGINALVKDKEGRCTLQGTKALKELIMAVLFAVRSMVGTAAVVLVAVVTTGGASIGGGDGSVGATMAMVSPVSPGDPGGVPAIVGGSVTFDARVPDIVKIVGGCTTVNRV